MKAEWKAYYRIKKGDIRIVIQFKIETKTVFIYRVGFGVMFIIDNPHITKHRSAHCTDQV